MSTETDTVKLSFDDITNHRDLALYISQHAERIFVRARVSGRWGSFALTEIPAPEAISQALRFIVDDRIPYILTEDLNIGTAAEED